MAAVMMPFDDCVLMADIVARSRLLAAETVHVVAGIRFLAWLHCDRHPVWIRFFLGITRVHYAYTDSQG